MPSKRPLPTALYWRAMKEARPWLPQLAVILALGFVATPIALLAPLPVKIVIDSVLGDRPLPDFLASRVPAGAADSKEALLLLSVAFVMLVALVKVIHETVEFLYRETIADRMVRRFKGNVLGNALGLSLARDEDKGVVDQVFRINHDAPALQAMTIWGVLPLAISGMAVVWVLSVTAFISTDVALVALATAVPLILLIYVSQRSLCDRWHRVRAFESGITRLVYEALGAQRVVVTCGREGDEVERLVDQARACYVARFAVLTIECAFKVALALATGIGTAAIIHLGVRDVQAGLLTAGDFVLLLSYMAQLYDPLKAIALHIIGQQAAFACGERAFELLETPATVAQATDPVPLLDARGAVEFRGVSFLYPGGRPVLRRASFRIEPGSCVGIVGQTGSGKSTLINLLVRLVDPVEGEIRLDGIDIRRYRITDLRRQFSIMEQEPALFTMTVAENIAYGRPDATPAEIEAAARRARAHGFIRALPHGYGSMVGERGARLSGGERQRLCLARAFLKDAPILVLDEPTSALDQETEAAITAGVEELMAGRTTFIIAHRLSTLRRADVVLRVHDGRVTVEGASGPVLAAAE